MLTTQSGFVTANQEAEDSARAEAERRHRAEELRVLVADMDSLILACEEAHLDRQRRVDGTLTRWARATFTAAGDVLHRPELLHRPVPRRIVDLMDVVWSAEEEALTLLVVARQCFADGRLPDDAEDEWFSAA